MKLSYKKKTLSSSPKTNSFIWEDISQSDLSEMWLEVNRDNRESNTSLIPIIEIKRTKPTSPKTPIQIVEVKHPKPMSYKPHIQIEDVKSPKPASSRAPIGTRKSNRKGTPHPDDAGKK
jgi:hypothetical protein